MCWSLTFTARETGTSCSCTTRLWMKPPTAAAASIECCSRKKTRRRLSLDSKRRQNFPVPRQKYQRAHARRSIREIQKQADEHRDQTVRAVDNRATLHADREAQRGRQSPGGEFFAPRFGNVSRPLSERRYLGLASGVGEVSLGKQLPFPAGHDPTVFR